MEIDPSSSLEEMIEQCMSSFLRLIKPYHYLGTQTYSWLIADENGVMGKMMQDLAFAIPGVDEAMGFAEIMKYGERQHHFPSQIRL